MEATRRLDVPKKSKQYLVKIAQVGHSYQIKQLNHLYNQKHLLNLKQRSTRKLLYHQKYMQLGRYTSLFSDVGALKIWSFHLQMILYSMNCFSKHCPLSIAHLKLQLSDRLRQNHRWNSPINQILSLYFHQSANKCYH
ncbi:hypothetical protein FGO68_gene10730 [Halteria grandinella]|uniref:Uncharacterized protein n=1 Tax=Halteria grandinella TaxID=5974 RepID=A0A8J8T8G8_HALGN|nr:hypothetical protein FGO68_gene10730 [Halteria grandinella]